MFILLDTNVVLRLIEPGHAHHTTAIAATRSLQQAGHSLCLVPQILYEFWVAVTRPVAQNGMGMSSAEALEELDHLGPPLFRLLRDERAIFERWRDLVVSHHVQGKQAHDARLVAAMKRHGLTHILTFNTQDFKQFPAIQTLDPALVVIYPEP